MSSGGISRVITDDERDGILRLATYYGGPLTDVVESMWADRHSRFRSMLYEPRSLLSPYAYWVLRRGHGDFNILPLDVRRIVIHHTRIRYQRAVPLEEIVARCEAAGDKKLADHVRGFMGGRCADMIYRPGQDYREWAL